MPEPMVKQDGREKNEGERHAAKRCIVTLRQAHPPLKCIITEDRRSSRAPHIETRHDDGCHDLLGVKEGDPADLFNQVQAAQQAGRGTASERHDRAAGVVHRFRLVNDVPLTASRAAVQVHCLAYGESSQDQVQPCSGVTDLRVRQRPVSQLMRGGRARWPSEHATCNTLKNPGDKVEHTEGHGEQPLAVVCATRRRLAFVVAHTQQRCWAFCRAVWTKLGSQRLVWERLRALFSAYRLEAMREVLDALLDGFEKSHPLLITDTS